MPHFDVTVVGELNLDLILYGLPPQLEPERELMADGLALTLGSSSAIFAHNLAVMGSKVGFISRIGEDPLGEIALARLAAGGVDVSQVRKVAGPASTGLTVILPRAGWRNILTYPGTMFEMCFEDLNLDYLAGAKHFHLSSFFIHRALRPRTAELFRLMKLRGLTTSLDTNDDPDDRWDDDLFEVLKYVDVFLPNEREAKKITHSDNLDAAVALLRHRVPMLAVKLGAAGAMACGRSGSVRSAAPTVEAIDPVGAGDSFDAGFIHAFVRGGDLAECLAQGNAAGAFSTTRPGGTEAFRDREYFAHSFPPSGANRHD
ncbi:MAG: sugar kinase [Acidobacteriota bacterium]|nr:sugar kinase [Acidobacteriota bacterium]